MWKFIVILNLHLVLGTDGSMNGPQNMVVMVSQRFEMKCETDNSSMIREWSLQKSVNSTIREIFVNWKDRQRINNPRFGVGENINGSVALYANSTEMDDAGIYICTVQERGRQPRRYGAHLIVFEAEPRCETSLSISENILEEGAHIWMRCTVNYRGNLDPTMEWRLHGGTGETDKQPRDLTGFVSVDIVPNVNASSTLAIHLNVTSNSSFYTCKIYFTLAGRGALVTAGNPPDYSWTWMSPLVTVVASTHWNVITTKYNDEMDLKSISVVVLSILFGAAILSVLIIIVYTRRKKIPAARPIDHMDDQIQDQYYTITYDGYDTIEEVDINDDVMIPQCCPAEESLPKPNYYTLKYSQKEANRTYADIDTYEQPVN